MNSGTSSTELNDMLTNFVNYVDSFYGVNDPLYPMINQETKQPLSKVDILVQQITTYLCVVTREFKQIASGGMETHLIVRESETFYLKSTTTNLWRNNETIQISYRKP